ncbi:hypothetical protein IMY05_C4521000700 [Salix suchowensis]|nr:hypothetical protein IMY05_C4521000700 [Salix suchowensis]
MFALAASVLTSAYTAAPLVPTSWRECLPTAIDEAVGNSCELGLWCPSPLTSRSTFDRLLPREALVFVAGGAKCAPVNPGGIPYKYRSCRGHLVGGHLARVLHYSELEDYVINGPVVKEVNKVGLIFHGVYSDIEVLQYPASVYLHVKADVTIILPLLSARECISVALKHGIVCGSKCTKSLIISMSQDHSCAICYSLTYVFEVKNTKKFTTQLSHMPVEEKKKLEKNGGTLDEITDFPPLPTSKYAVKNIVTACAKRMEFSAVQEAGCAVCGQLVPKTELSRLRQLRTCFMYWRFLE